MNTHIVKRFAIAVALLAAAAGAQAASSNIGARDAFTNGARSVQEPRSPYSDGARDFDTFTEGARTVDPYLDGARTLAGLDRTGVSAEPSRSVDPYLDGAYA
ncbi:hydroxyquinol 1,2-dioxygenase (plasmid) [Cupriavidus sp. KK10]|uniref:hydroxyquinol 1,2-dioxygenase n=1 Tax=Cupriavidus sp. KK10 TaxID=1478019 RepID=UPI001BAAE266|nr:hydroxyquinol 1,2-dioxygenase [Cupriavidus sp. KK10]QUN32433.1 hydroxyquinol 1,2-dioxygenase [Cupriavidus sp. KK10]